MNEKIVLCDGRVTLFCGDSLELLNAGELKFDAIVSDPPYGIGFKHGGSADNTPPGRPNSVLKTKHTAPIIGDDKPFDPAPWVKSCGTVEPKAIVLFGADHFKTRLPEGGRFICWDKSCGQGAATLFCDAEFAWTNRKNARSIFRHLWVGISRSDDGFDSKTTGRHHVSQKPVNLMAWCIEHARIGLDKIVLDPFMGSGSTGVAALMSGRKFVGVEIDPAHFEIARQRIEKAWAMMQGAEQTV